MASQIMSQDIGHDPKEQSTRVAHHHDRFRRLHRAPRGNRAPVPGTCLRLPVAFATQTGADTHRQAADREDPDAPPCLCRRQTGASGLPRPIARQSRGPRCRPLGNGSSPRNRLAPPQARSAAGTGAAGGFGARPVPIGATLSLFPWQPRPVRRIPHPDPRTGMPALAGLARGVRGEACRGSGAPGSLLGADPGEQVPTWLYPF